ncbi:MAG TPA: M67 family metallopeptidase [Myxococcales bacterium]|nr:M67 family metallopeptidase [Myxococcales bacterium]
MNGISPPVLREMAAHARKAYPEECCGVLIEDASGALSFRPIANIAGSIGAAGISARTNRDGYVMDPRGLMAAQEEADRLVGRLWGIVHSHPDVGAYFSREDRAKALDDAGQEPLWPGVRYLVISARASGIDRALLYTWDAARHDFIEEEVREIAGLY